MVVFLRHNFTINVPKLRDGSIVLVESLCVLPPGES